MTAQTAAYPTDKLRWVKTPTRNAESDNQPVADTVAKVLAETAGASARVEWLKTER